MSEPNLPSDDRSFWLQAFKTCRDEVMHEQKVLAARLTSYITSQSFLISAYAVSMNNWGPPRSAHYRLAFPLVLCLLGFLLSLRANPGIVYASQVIHRWHEKQDQLLVDHPELSEFDVLRSNSLVRKRVRDQWFAQTAAYIFALAWITFAAISLVMFLWR